MKGVPTQVVKREAAQLYPDMSEIEGVCELYSSLLRGESIAFDLTANGTRACFDVVKNFTVKSRDFFTRRLKFPAEEILEF